MTRRYNVWAGNPAGVAEDLTRCIESVWDKFHSHQCERKRGRGPDGLYCAVHDPAAVKARQDRSASKWKEAHTYDQRKWDDQLVGARLRESNPALYEELKRPVVKIAVTSTSGDNSGTDISKSQVVENKDDA